MFEKGYFIIFKSIIFLDLCVVVIFVSIMFVMSFVDDIII